jgi:uncharacterized protein
VLALLPPSEGKADAPAGAAPADLTALVHADVLTAAREDVLTRLERLVRGPKGKALAALGLSAGQAGELERDRDLRAAPAAPAADVYTGVLFQRLDLASLTAAQRRRAAERLLVQSALWGVVRLEDRIPAYRLAIGAKLPRLPAGGLAALWRAPLAAALPAEGLVVDLRSGGYAKAWRPAGGEVVAVGARTPEGKVVSHMAKATRGDVARLLCTSRATPRSPQDVADQAGS